ncbi:MAG TPA: hypothetical protein VHB20_04300 [Verrucomicrobiae bacterium]|nr:hypothetical protein [Verrucomicrobiae bacterium]
MKVLHANCRVQFTAEDVAFVLETLGHTGNDAAALVALLTDEAARDCILDNPALVRALLEKRCCLRVSHHFYFYVVVRHVFRQSGLDDRALADYVAELLAHFSREDQAGVVVPGQPQPLQYYFEMLAALQTADDYTTFSIRAHIGNHSLFLSGVFPDRIRHRAERRGFPNLRYYEDMGRSSFRALSDHRLARRYELSPIFETLSQHFERARLALNEVSDRIFSVGDPEVPLRQFFP